MLIDHMKTGLSFESFGAVANVGIRTLFDWKKAFPDFADAYEIGKAHSLRTWEQMGMIQIWSGKGAPAVWIYNMKNRFGWRDEPEKETAEMESAEAPTPVTAEERMELLKIARGEKK